jgi:hypothetical protein
VAFRLKFELAVVRRGKLSPKSPFGSLLISAAFPDTAPVRTLFRFLRLPIFRQNTTSNGPSFCFPFDRHPICPVFFPVSRECGGEWFAADCILRHSVSTYRISRENRAKSAVFGPFGRVLRPISILWVPFSTQRRPLGVKFSAARRACPFQNGLESSNSVLSAIQSARILLVQRIGRKPLFSAHFRGYWPRTKSLGSLSGERGRRKRATFSHDRRQGPFRRALTIRVVLSPEACSLSNP